MALVIASPLVASVLPIINLPMALGNLPTSGNGLPLVPIGNDQCSYMAGGNGEGGGGGGGLLNRQNLLSMTKVIC